MNRRNSVSTMEKKRKLSGISIMRLHGDWWKGDNGAPGERILRLALVFGKTIAFHLLQLLTKISIVHGVTKACLP